MQTIESIQDEVADAIASNRPLVIKGYVSSSGAVTDYAVRVIGSSGYRALVEQAIDELQRGVLVVPDGADKAVWEQARAEQAVSWQKTLDGEHRASQWGDSYAQNGRGYFTKAGEDVVYIKHLSVIEKEIVTPETSTVNSATKTKYKKLIVDQSPLGSYLAVLKLAPEKVISVNASYGV